MWKTIDSLSGADINIEAIAADDNGNFMCGTLAKSYNHDGYFVVDDSSMMTAPTHYMRIVDLKASLKDFKLLQNEFTRPRTTEAFEEQCSIVFNQLSDMYEFRYKGKIHYSSKSKFECKKAKLGLRKTLAV